jgi:exonuclease SbcC
MILTRLHVHTFGCFTNQRMDFQKGLNVMLGPNEAGKSTVFQAIQKTLLVPSKLKKLDFEREMARFLPVGGGDTLEAELEFQIGTGRFVLRRSWGSRPASQLLLPGGSTMNDENTIMEKLATLLPAKPGTFKSVLMTYQSGLARTIEELKSDPSGTVQTLSDILRTAVLETDGVSIDQFKGRIDALYDRHFSHWDSRQNYPEKGKGIENPYVKEVGEILRAFYEKERIRVSLKEARHYEERLDAINQQIERSAKHVAEKEEYLRRNKKVVEDARERRTREAELKAVQSHIEIMKKANSEWPVSESKVEEMKKLLPSLEKKRDPLENEKKEVEIEERNKGFRERFQRILHKKEALQKAREEFKSVTVLERNDLEEFRKASAVIHQMKVGLEAGRLSVRLRTKQASDLAIQRDFDTEFQKKISKDELLHLEAGGRLKLTHPEWEIEVTSGKINFNEKQQQYRQAEEKLKSLLHKHGLDTVEKAIEENQIYEKHLIEIKKANENLSAELGTESFQDVESKIKAIGHQKATRPIAGVIEELAKLQYEIEGLKKDLDHHQHVINTYQAKYRTKDDLLLDLAEAVRKEKNLAGNIGQLSALPEGADNPEIFIRQYEQIQTEVERMRERKNELVLQKSDLERESPGTSAEELAKGLSEVEEQFASVVKQGEAIERIKTLTQSLLGKMDTDTFTSLKKGMEETVSFLTGQRYTRIEMAGCLPQGFLRGDGVHLPYDLLSQGTKNILSLALRLVMAEHFLKDADGFLMMDDPLVDLDPERQGRAAETLKSFAEKKQFLIFTCHPSSAALLGGHLINL